MLEDTATLIEDESDLDKDYENAELLKILPLYNEILGDNQIKQYDRQFLLQLQFSQLSLIKPANIPNDILRNNAMPKEMRQLQKCKAPTSYVMSCHDVSQFCMKEPNKGDDTKVIFHRKTTLCSSPPKKDLSSYRKN